MRLRVALAGSYLWGAGAPRNLQDPLSYRAVVQVNGALRDALGFACGQLAIELNAHHDNPIVLTDEDRLISAGNYDILPLAAALDFVRIALAIDLRMPRQLGTVTRRVRARVRERIAFVQPDNYPVDLEPIVDLVRTAVLAQELQSAVSG